MLLTIQSWSVLHWICFVVLWFIVLNVAMTILGKVLGGPSWVVPFVGVFVVPLIAAMILMYAGLEVTAVFIGVLGLIIVGRQEGGMGLVLLGIPLLLIAIAIWHPQVLMPIGYIAACILGGCAP